MKSIRSLFMIAIGMMVFTVTANTTAKLEQEKKVELVNGFEVQKHYSQVVEVLKEIQILQETSFTEVRTVSLKRVVNESNSYVVSKDVGWRSSQTINYTIRKNAAVNYFNQTKLSSEKNSYRNDC